jgi:aspartyl-tRNA(Asn)/glutamyl-tRNA(Gln) amidotransferase subunit A
MGLGSIGTDTGGSVRHPGSNSNLVALRPTHGRISGFGVHGSSVTTDQAGPLTKTVEDNAIMMHILGVYDPKDPISVNEPRYDYQPGMQDGIKGIRIGVPVDDWVWKDWLSEEEETVCREAISVLQELGASVTEVALPRAAEARSNSFSSRAPGALIYTGKFTREQLDAWPEVGTGIDEALQESAVDYLRLQQHRALIRQEANEVLRNVDVIAMPTGSTYGDAWDAENIVIRGRTVPARSRAVYRNALASICGQPAISVPCGFGNNDRWPIGLMLHGRELREALLYRIAWAYEQATPWHKRHPNLDYDAQA